MIFKEVTYFKHWLEKIHLFKCIWKWYAHMDQRLIYRQAAWRYWLLFTKHQVAHLVFHTHKWWKALWVRSEACPHPEKDLCPWWKGGRGEDSQFIGRSLLNLGFISVPLPNPQGFMLKTQNCIHGRDMNRRYSSHNAQTWAHLLSVQRSSWEGQWKVE